MGRRDARGEDRASVDVVLRLRVWLTRRRLRLSRRYRRVGRRPAGGTAGLTRLPLVRRAALPGRRAVRTRLARLAWLHVLRRLTVRLLGCAQPLHRRAVLTWALGRLRALRPLGTTLRRRAVRSRLPLALRLARHRLVELTGAGRRAELAGATLLPRLLSRRTVLSWRWAELTLRRPVRALPWRRTELSGALLPLRRLLRSARPLAVRRLSLRPARHARRGTELALPRLGVRGLGPLALGWPESLWSGLTWPALRSLWALLTRLTLG